MTGSLQEVLSIVQKRTFLSLLQQPTRTQRVFGILAQEILISIRYVVYWRLWRLLTMVTWDRKTVYVIGPGGLKSYQAAGYVEDKENPPVADWTGRSTKFATATLAIQRELILWNQSDLSIHDGTGLC